MRVTPASFAWLAVVATLGCSSQRSPPDPVDQNFSGSGVTPTTGGNGSGGGDVGGGNVGGGGGGTGGTGGAGGAGGTTSTGGAGVGGGL